MKPPRFSYENKDISKKNQLKRGLARHEQWVEAILPADAEAGQVETETNRRPLWLVGVATVLVLGVLVSRMFVLQIVQGKTNLSYADNQRIRSTVIRAPRGVVYDRNRTILVQNQSNYDITVVPQRLPQSEGARMALYQQVSAATGVAVADMVNVIETSCIAVQRKQGKSAREAILICLGNPQPLLVASNIDRDHALLFDQRALDFPAFSLDINPIRQYLDNGTLSQTLGYTGRISLDELKDAPNYLQTDYIGKLGLEKQYENILRGVNGSQQSEVDASGKPVKVLASQSALPGNSLVLSIDMGLEQHMSDYMNQQLQAAQAKGIKATQAAGVALDPTTGEILASVSLPTYDNNLFAKGISQDDFLKLVNDAAQPLFNKPIDGTYPTGSIIKPLIGSAALQEHIVTPSSTVNDTGQLELPNPYDAAHPYIFRSYEAGGFGPLNITGAIRLSSNVFFYTMGGGFGNIVGLGVDRLTRYYRDYGLGSKPGIDLPGQAAGLVPTPDWKQKVIGQPWYVGDTYNISVGQGELKVSPLQMADAIAGVANSGTIYKPHLVTQVLDDQNRVIQTIKPEVAHKVPVSADNYKLIQNAMREVMSVPGGTGCCLTEQALPGLVAGKTGTAETGGDAGPQLPHAWFEAYAPYTNPHIVVVILIQNSGEGAIYAAPAVRQTLNWYFRQGAGKQYAPNLPAQ